MLTLRKTLAGMARKAIQRVEAIKSDQRGVSAIEFSFFAGMLSFGMLNVADISIYLYKRMQLENATQMGVQAAWKLCDPSNNLLTQPVLPATTNCPGLQTTVTNAVRSTSLGSNVSIQSGSLTEGFYCPNSSGTLVLVGPISSSKPADCSATLMPSLRPGDYIQVTAQFPYAPMFPGVTVAGKFATPITYTAMMRLD